jgi:hypothetical protein
MLKSDLCPLTTRDLFVEEDVPKETDNWWRRVRVDIRNNQLASSRTPSRYVQERVMLVLPEQWLDKTKEAELTPEQKEQRKYILEWAAALKIDLAPTDESDGSTTVGGGTAGSPDAAAAILSPSDGDDIDGLVEIVGRAAVDDFEEYRLEYGSGTAPFEWIEIITVPFERDLGVLGVWNTNDMEDGVYTLRLMVTDEDGEEYEASVVVRVD